MIFHMFRAVKPDQSLVIHIKSDRLFNLRDFFSEGGSHDHGCQGSSEGLFTHHPFDVQAMNSMTFLMVTIKAQLLVNKEQNENGAGQANGQTRHIDQGKNLILTDISERYSKEISPHRIDLNCNKNSNRATKFKIL